MPKINIGNVLGQANPMNMIGHMNLGNPLHSIQDAFGNASHMSPMTQAMGMMQRHPQDPQMQSHMDENGMRQMLGQHMSQQQNPQMPDQTHPNPMVNMSGMNMSQMLGMHPQGQDMSSPMMNPGMGTKSGIAPMGTPMGTPMAHGVNGNVMNAMNALNAQRPSDAFVNPQQQKIQQFQNMASMIGRNK